MLTTPGGRSAWRQTSAKRRADSGRRGGGLQDDRVAGGEGRGDLPGQHQQREVPRDDLGGHAERLRDPARERVLELVRPAGVVPEVGRRERDVDVARFLDRLAGVHRFEDRELARALLEDPGDPEQVLRPLPARQRAPRSALRAPGGPDGLVDVRRGRPRDLGQRLLRRRIDRGERLAVGGGDVLAVDEQAVALLERDDVARLGGRGVLPRDRLRRRRGPSCWGCAVGAPGPRSCWRCARTMAAIMAPGPPAGPERSASARRPSATAPLSIDRRDGWIFSQNRTWMWSSWPVYQRVRPSRMRTGSLK